MSLEVEVAEGEEPLERCDEDKSEDDTDSLEENNDGVDLNVVNLLSEVVLQLISVDQEVAAKKSRNAKTEEETLDIDDSFDDQEDRCEDSEPFEEVSVGKVADEGASSAF